MKNWVSFLICAVLGLGLILCGLMVPAHLRAVDDTVLERAARDTPGYIGQALALAYARNLGAAQMLEEAGRGSETLDLYERAWRKLKQPGKMHEGARAQSSWYRVGVRYAELLDRAGDPRGARSVRNRLSPNE